MWGYGRGAAIAGFVFSVIEFIPGNHDRAIWWMLYGIFGLLVMQVSDPRRREGGR